MSTTKTNLKLSQAIKNGVIINVLHFKNKRLLLIKSILIRYFKTLSMISAPNKMMFLLKDSNLIEFKLILYLSAVEKNPVISPFHFFLILPMFFPVESCIRKKITSKSSNNICYNLIVFIIDCKSGIK